MQANSLADFEHMQMAVNALFTFDDAGRMHRINESGGDIAPRFFLGRTRVGNLWCFRHDLPAALVQQLDGLCAREPVAPNAEALRQPPLQHHAIMQALAGHSPISNIYTGPEFRFPDPIVQPPGSTAKRITAADTECLRPHFAWMIAELDSLPPAFGVEREGVFVATCFSSRTTPAADEAGVFTAEGHRGLGFASACVAAWAAAIRDLGRRPIYGTWWENTASQAVAAKLGLIQFGTALQIR